MPAGDSVVLSAGGRRLHTGDRRAHNSTGVCPAPPAAYCRLLQPEGPNIITTAQQGCARPASTAVATRFRPIQIPAGRRQILVQVAQTDTIRLLWHLCLLCARSWTVYCQTRCHLLMLCRQGSLFLSFSAVFKFIAVTHMGESLPRFLLGIRNHNNPFIHPYPKLVT